jgi:hydroxymethylpyrimidine/phosphomethylpyrimidine kinase
VGYKVKNLVVDPVMVSTSGHRLLDEDAIAAIRKLIKHAALSTPNLHEAAVLAEMRIESEEDMVAAAKKLGDCVVKGGHLNAVDILHYEGKIYRFPSKDKKDFSIHGTGCAFSAAVACGLALGKGVPDSVAAAKVFMDDVIGRSFSPGGGLRLADTAGIMKATGKK